MKYNGKLIKHTILVEQEVLTRPEHLSLFPLLCGICVSVAFLLHYLKFLSIVLAAIIFLFFIFLLDILSFIDIRLLITVWLI